LGWTEPAPEQRLAGVLVRGADHHASVALRVTGAGELQVRLHAI
jgi:hypothetical protein